MYSRNFIIVLIWIFSVPAFGQQNKVGFQVYNNNFFYDREYFNLIADSYTLAGHILTPSVSYSIASGWKIHSGFESFLYWGIRSKPFIRPVFYLDYRKGGHIFRFGTLNRYEGHKLLRPLMQYDYRFRPDQAETGIQYLYGSQDFETEIWLNWKNFIQKADTLREVIQAGWRSEKQILSGEKWRIKLPLQILLLHRGGQINLKGPYLKEKNNTMTVVYGAAGVQFSYPVRADFDLHFFGYYLFHTMNTDNPEEFVFNKGHAFYGGISLYREDLFLKLAYWDAYRLNAPTGEDIFQTVSHRIDRYYENGELLKIFENHYEPHRNLVVFSMGFYRNFSGEFQFRISGNVFYQPYKSEISGYDFLYPVENQIDYAMTFEFIFLRNRKN